MKPGFGAVLVLAFVVASLSRRRRVPARVRTLFPRPDASPSGGRSVHVGFDTVATAYNRRRRRRAVLEEVPDVVDLFRLAVGAGCNIRLATEAVVRHASGVVADGLRSALHQVDMGERLADALDGLHHLGEPARPMLDALVASDRYGAPIVPALERVAAEARTIRRRRAEELARRVPVKLLFPLVFCTLPAFGLLTVVPLLARSLPALAP